LALARTYAGAIGQKKRQMADVLHFLLEDEELHAVSINWQSNSTNTAPFGKQR
jgi:serine protease inhibitor